MLNDMNVSFPCKVYKPTEDYNILPIAHSILWTLHYHKSNYLILFRVSNSSVNAYPRSGSRKQCAAVRTQRLLTTDPPQEIP